MWKLHEIQIPTSVRFHWHRAPLAPHIVCGGFALWWQSWGVTTDMKVTWPAKLKIFTVWPWIESLLTPIAKRLSTDNFINHQWVILRMFSFFSKWWGRRESSLSLALSPNNILHAGVSNLGLKTTVKIIFIIFTPSYHLSDYWSKSEATVNIFIRCMQIIEPSMMIMQR